MQVEVYSEATIRLEGFGEIEGLITRLEVTDLTDGPKYLIVVDSRRYRDLKYKHEELSWVMDGLRK